MGETAGHRILVEYLGEFVIKEYRSHPTLAVDLDFDNRPDSPRPPNINGNIPDLFARDALGKVEVVGEAKTASDLDTIRSYNQIENFLQYVFSNNQASFILCVPWQLEIFAEGIIEKIVQDNDLILPRYRVLGMEE